jgi:hypothetical protein
MKRKKQILKEIKNLVMEYKSLNEAVDPSLKKAIGQTIKGASTSYTMDEEYLTIVFNNNKTLELHAAPESYVGDETYINSDTDIKKMKGKTIKNIENLDNDTEVKMTMTDGTIFTFTCDSESNEGAVFNYYFK